MQTIRSFIVKTSASIASMPSAVRSFVAAAVCLAAAAVPVAAAAEELKPFYTAKVAGPAALIAISEKIADLAGLSETEEFKIEIEAFKKISGVNSKGFFGFALAVNQDDEFIPLILLPVTDFNIANIPGHEEVFDKVRKNLKKAAKEKDTYTFEYPEDAVVPGIPPRFYKWTIKLQKGHCVLVPSIYADAVPAAAEKLFEGMDDDAFVQNINTENIKFELIEKNVFLPFLAAIAAREPDSEEMFKVMLEFYRHLFNEFRSVTVSLHFDPKTADAAYAYRFTPRKGTASEKTFNEFGKATTLFSGFKGSPADRVFSLNTSQKIAASEKEIDLGKKYLDLVFAGLIKELEDNDEDEQDIKLAKDAIQSVKNLWHKQIKAEHFDTAVSADVNGVVTAAVSLADTKELQHLVKMLYDHIAKKAAEEEPDFDLKKFVSKNLTKDHATVEGFKISRLQIPVAEFLAAINIKDDENLPWPKDFKPVISVFWAVKENAAVAVAVGSNAEKTEEVFKKALAGTKTPVPAEQPLAELSLPNLGKLLQQAVLPIAEKKVAEEKADDEEFDDSGFRHFKKGVTLLSKADKSAVLSLSAVNSKDGLEVKYLISGKLITAIADMIKALNTPELKRDVITDF